MAQRRSRERYSGQKARRGSGGVGELALEAGDVDALVDFERKAPAGRLAHPRTEHFAPLFVSVGASLAAGDTPRSVIDGYWYGLSKRSVQFD
jgi:4,5-DOPA dioxygenase extradiol